VDKDQAKLEAFKARFTSNSLVDFWSNADELSTKALAALSQAKQSHPGVGWLRANAAASEDLLNEINNLRKLNEEVSKELAASKPNNSFDDLNLAQLNQTFSIRYKHRKNGYRSSSQKAIDLSWSEILGVIGRQFRTPSNTSGVQKSLEGYLKAEHPTVNKEDSAIIEMRDKETILMQMEALGFMKAKSYALKNGGSSLFHELTSHGTSEFIKINAILEE